MSPKNTHIGGRFDELLAGERILDEVTERATKRALAMSFAQAMETSGMTKAALAAAMKTSRRQVDRLFDGNDTSITLHAMVKAAHALGGRLRISFEYGE